MFLKRLKLTVPLVWLLIGIAGMAGIAGWYAYTVEQTIFKTNARWVDRMGRFVDAQLASRKRFLQDLSPSSSDSLASIARQSNDIVALFDIDSKNRIAREWRSDRLEGFDANHPRLGVLQLKAVETNQFQTGPLIFFNKKLLSSWAIPFGNSHVLLILTEESSLLDLISEESELWQVKSFVYDEDRNPLFHYGPSPFPTPVILDLYQRIRSGGEKSGIVPLLYQKEIWRGLATYHYEFRTRWTFIVIQSAIYFYFPFFFFLIALIAMLAIVKIPFEASYRIRKEGISIALEGYAIRVDNFIRGKDAVLADPPSPHTELMLIAQSLRWMMPLWKRAEAFPKELNLERRLLALLIESLPEGILFFNAQGGLQLSNELGRVFLGLQQEAGKEMKLVNGIQISRGFMEPFLEPVLTGSQPNLGKEVEVAWADGKHLYRVWVEKVEGDPGKTLGFISVIRDITFRKQWENVQEQMLSAITHDLRGPLSAVMGYIDLGKKILTKENGNPKVLEYLTLAREGGLRLNQMVTDILDAVRFEQGKVDMEIESILVVDVFQRLQNTFGVMSEQKKINLKLQVHGESSMAVTGDRKLLDRVLDNLVGNALKFTPPDGTITVSAKKGQGRITFEVSDTGRGIPKEAQSRIFDKFQQVNPGDRAKGYGLGLSVVKFIIEAHKGEIHVDSEVDKGSRFIFWLPDVPAPVKS